MFSKDYTKVRDWKYINFNQILKQLQKVREMKSCFADIWPFTAILFLDCSQSVKRRQSTFWKFGIPLRSLLILF
jgi:hypothetical protein